MNPSDYKRYRENVVKDALGQIKFNPAKKPVNPIDAVVNRAKAIVAKISTEQIRPVLQAGGGKDKAALFNLISRSLLTEFNSFTKDELLQLCVVMHLEVLSDIVDADPAGTGKPDLLSGV